jgi:hypothetical protein
MFPQPLARIAGVWNDLTTAASRNGILVEHRHPNLMHLAIGSAGTETEGRIMTTPKREKNEDGDFGYQKPSEKRNGMDRRKELSEGFACVSTVGWICRREKTRRKDDSYLSEAIYYEMKGN